MKDATPGRDDAGVAIVFVILLMLALLALAHAALVASLSERAASRAAVRELELEGAARWALENTFAPPLPSWADSAETWEERSTDLGPVGAMEAVGVFRRLGPESWLVEGEASDARGVRARTARLAWSLDPLTRVVSVDAVVSVAPAAPLTLGGTLDASAPAAVEPPMEAWACDPWVADLVARYAAAPLGVVGPLPDSAAAPALGLLDLEALLTLAPVTVAGTGTPAPTESAGSCVVDEPWGWGDPDRPWRPCGNHLPMRAATGDLTVSGGAGQGLLVVEGDLTVRDGARFYGLIVAGGVLRLAAGATLEGMALAAGGLFTDPGTTLRGSGCWAVRALAAQGDALGGLVPLAGVGRLGPL